MAGQPITNARYAMLDANADYIMELLEEGQSLKTISVRLTDKLEEPISHAMVGKWCQQAENEQRVTRARAIAADSRAESVLDRSDTLVRDVALGIKGKEDIAAARLANDADQWIAGVWNRQRYGQQNAASVTVNIGQLHMEALRQAPAIAAVRPPELEAFDVEDVEYVETPARTLSDLL